MGGDGGDFEVESGHDTKERWQGPRKRNRAIAPSRGRDKFSMIDEPHPCDEYWNCCSKRTPGSFHTSAWIGVDYRQ
jgi:hypothetical protein